VNVGALALSKLVLGVISFEWPWVEEESDVSVEGEVGMIFWGEVGSLWGPVSSLISV